MRVGLVTFRREPRLQAAGMRKIASDRRFIVLKSAAQVPRAKNQAVTGLINAALDIRD
jgi:hypothetical protein